MQNLDIALVHQPKLAIIHAWQAFHPGDVTVQMNHGQQPVRGAVTKGNQGRCGIDILQAVFIEARQSLQRFGQRGAIDDPAEYARRRF